MYVGSDDAILYAIGPIGPAGVPSALPSLPVTASEDIWPALQHDEQRVGFVTREGVEYPGFIYDQGTQQYNTGVRWVTPTASTLYGSPTLGMATSSYPQGILYLPTTSDIDANGNFLSGGAVMAMDADWGGILWRFDNNGTMGQVYGAPAVLDIQSTDDQNNSSTQEMVVFGTEDQQNRHHGECDRGHHRGQERHGMAGTTISDRTAESVHSRAVVPVWHQFAEPPARAVSAVVGRERPGGGAAGG